MNTKRCVTIRGNDYERGRQAGEALGYSVKVNLCNQIRHYKENSGYDFSHWINACKSYIPLVRQYTPHTYEELRGLADGAGLAFEEVLSLTSAYELAVAGGNVADKCTGFFAAGTYTEDGGAICGQTNDEDFSEWIPYLDVVLKHQNTEGPSALVYTHPGIAAYMGMNNAGLSVLWQYIDNGERAADGLGVPTNCIIRELLFYDDLDDAVAFLKQVPHTIPNHYLISHRTEGAASVECYPGGIFVRKSKTNLCHANNILTEEKMDGCDKKNPLVYRKPFSVRAMEEDCYRHVLEGNDGILEWSYLRYDRICQLLEEHKGAINAEMGKRFLSDHEYAPFSICSHPNFVNTRWKTLASIIFDMERETMYIAFGCGCEEEFYQFGFDDSADL